MSCVINDFKNHFNIPLSKSEVKLSEFSPEVIPSVLNYVELLNTSAQKEGYRENLIEVRGFQEDRHLKFNQDKIDEFNEYIQLYEQYETAMENEIREELESQRTWEEIEGVTFGEDDFLYSYSPTLPSFTSTPATFYEWKSNLEKTKESLQSVADRYSKLGEKDKLKGIYDAIEEIDNNILSVDSTDPNSIYESSIREIESLTKILNNIAENPREGANALDGNRLTERINDLRRYFLAYDEQLGREFRHQILDDESKPIAQFFFDFSKGLDEAKVKDLQNKITDLTSLNERMQVRVLQGLLLEDDLVQDLLYKGKWTGEEVEKVLDMLESKDVEVGRLASLFLGAASGGGILGQLLVSIRDGQLNRERGITQERVTSLTEAWNKIKDITYRNAKGGKEYLSNLLFEKDAHGVRTFNLKNPYTKEYGQDKKNVRAESNAFYRNRTDENYKSWMDAEKENFIRIHPAQISAIASKYRNHPILGKHFKYTTDEIREYEAELKATLGNIMFEVETKKALDKVEEYLDLVDAGALDYLQEHRRNPFVFMENFNSENYNKRDRESMEYLEPNFTVTIPRKETQYNPDFFELEEHPYSKELGEFYVIANDLLEGYANPIYRSEGVFRNTLELSTHEDILARETLKEINMYGKVRKYLSAMWDSITKPFFDKAIQNQREIEKAIENKTFKKELQVGFVGHARRELRELTEMLALNTLEDLYDIAESEGLSFQRLSVAEGSNLARQIKTDLARSIAQNRINESTSSNIFEAIQSSVMLANVIAARRASVATLEAMKSYVNSNSHSSEVGKENLHNISNFLGSWGDANIYGYKFSRDLSKKVEVVRDVSKKGRERVGAKVKKLSQAEKKLKKVILEEMERVNNGKDVFNFKTKDGIEYTTINGQYFASDSNIPISLTEITSLYNKYLQDKIDSLGIEMTWGSFTLGTVSSMIVKNLSLNPVTGYRNRTQGIVQNLAVASSGRYGFDLEDYHNSRKFLRGVNTRKYFFDKAFKNTKRGQQIQTLLLLQSRMDIRQNRADELSNIGKFESTTRTFIDNLRNFLMDFAINNPEWKNQSELMVSILQTINVTDKFGNVHKFFDGETGEFSIYKPGTLELKDDFATDENIAMWTRFQDHKGKRDSLIALSDMKLAIEETQGNYDNNDIIMIQNSVLGKASTVYQRYLYENTKMQWGTSKVDLRKGEFDIKGRKLVLMNHAPTSFMFLAGSYGVPLMVSIIAGAPIVGAALGTISLSALAIGIYKSRTHFKGKSIVSRDEWNISLNFAKEVAIRSINTPIAVLSQGRFNPFSETLKNMVERNAEKRNLDIEERKLLSESAQDLATKTFIWSSHTIAATLLSMLSYAVYAALKPDFDDDDEEKFIAFMEKVEKYINKIINTRNMLMNELDKFTEYAIFEDEAMSLAFWSMLARWGKFMRKDVPEYFIGEKEYDTDAFGRTINLTPWIPIPNSIIKSTLNSENHFQDARIYSPTTEIDKKLLSLGTGKLEHHYKKQVDEQRKYLKKIGLEYHTRRLKKQYPEWSSEEVEAAAENIRNSEIKNTYKKQGQSYKNLAESAVFEALKKKYESDLSLWTKVSKTLKNN